MVRCSCPIRSRVPRSVVVSTLDCGSEGFGFESHQSNVGFSSPDRLLPRAGSAVGPVGSLGSLTAQFHPLHGYVFDGVALTTSFTNTAGVAVSGPGSHVDNYDRKRGLPPCQVVSNRNGPP